MWLKQITNNLNLHSKQYDFKVLQIGERASYSTCTIMLSYETDGVFSCMNESSIRFMTYKCKYIPVHVL